MKFMKEVFAKKKRKALKESLSVSDDLVLNQIGEYLNFLEFIKEWNSKKNSIKS